MGVACFQVESSPSGLRLTHRVYDVLLLSQKPYLVNPTSLRFLINHGFDFNRQYSEGLSFDPGQELGPSEAHSEPNARGIFLHVLSSHKPVVLHNGFLDLIFMYHSFYGPLPKNLWTFVADLSEMFQGGLYDTKNMAEFSIREQASYLEYLFHKRFARVFVVFVCFDDFNSVHQSPLTSLYVHIFVARLCFKCVMMCFIKS